MTIYFSTPRTDTLLPDRGGRAPAAGRERGGLLEVLAPSGSFSSVSTLLRLTLLGRPSSAPLSAVVVEMKRKHRQHTQDRGKKRTAVK